MVDDPTQQSWWNRPLWGEGGLLKSNENENKTKLSIPEEAIRIHREHWELLKFTLSVLMSFDTLKFKDAEFQLFIQIKSYFAEGIGDYQGLNQSMVLLRTAIEAKDSFHKLESIELNC